MKKEQLPAHVLAELQQIVGEHFVTTDMARLVSYAWNSGIGKVPGNNKFAAVCPTAAIMPSSTEEVAAIVKCCVRHDIKYKAHSTGYGGMSHVHSPKAMVIDLRRMNTLAIDPLNRMAIIGPYATAGAIQAEALKHGMTTHIIGAGPVHSPLASATSLAGMGVTSQSTSMNVRNLLAWEWVSPEGEIVRGGSAATGKGWFSGEGPGPGTRGMIRGAHGAGGGMGVFTKIGFKLYPVPVKGHIEETGVRPQVGTVLPENCKLYFISWPSWEAHRQATFDILQDNLCWSLLRIPPEQLGWILTSSNADFFKHHKEGTLPDAARFENDKHWLLMTYSRSRGEHAWRTAVLKDIVERTSGKFIELTTEHEQVLARTMQTSLYVARVLRPSGGITTSFGVFDSSHFIPEVMKSGKEHLNGMNSEKGHLVHGGPEEHWSWTHESRYFWSENIVNFDPQNKPAREQAIFALLRHFPIMWKNHPGVCTWEVGPIMELQGNSIGAPQHTIRAVKHYMDPKDSSYSRDFIPFTVPKAVQTVLPLLKPLIVKDFVLKFAAKGIAKDGM